MPAQQNNAANLSIELVEGAENAVLEGVDFGIRIRRRIYDTGDRCTVVAQVAASQRHNESWLAQLRIFIGWALLAVGR
jgi:hypothetical protein